MLSPTLVGRDIEARAAWHNIPYGSLCTICDFGLWHHPTIYFYSHYLRFLKRVGAINWLFFLFLACVSVDYCGLSMFRFFGFLNHHNTFLFILRFLCSGLSILRLNGVFFFLSLCSGSMWVFFSLFYGLKFYTTTEKQERDGDSL